jgi:acetyl esterase/lipase
MSEEIVNLSTADLADFPIKPADRRIAYGEAPAQFVDLYRPDGAGLWPTLVLVHGGCWRAQYGLDHISLLARTLAERGVAVCSLEYRRLGDEGGGWPGTFLDVGRGTDLLRELAADERLDLDNVVAMGHSAGGHLVQWLGSRHRINPASPLYVAEPLPLKGVISLAGVADLAEAIQWGICGETPSELVGGQPEDIPERYGAASPAALLPTGTPQLLITGERDAIVPPAYVAEFAERAVAAGDPVEHIDVQYSAHFELIVPESLAWPVVWGAVQRMLGFAV